MFSKTNKLHKSLILLTQQKLGNSKNCASPRFSYTNISRCTIPWTSNYVDIFMHHLHLYF